MSRIIRVAIDTTLVYRAEVDIDLDDDRFDWSWLTDDPDTLLDANALAQALTDDSDETDSNMDAIARETFQEHDVYDAYRDIEILDMSDLEPAVDVVGSL